MKVVVANKAINLSIPKSKRVFLRTMAGLATLVTVVAVILGCSMLAFNSQEIYSRPLFLMTAGAFILLFFVVRRNLNTTQIILLILAAGALAGGILVSFLPNYLQGFNIQGIIHRSLLSGLLLLAISVPGVCYSLYYLLGATPRAFDISRYPLLFFFILVALVFYGLIIFSIIQNGALKMDWSLLTQSFQSQSRLIEEWQDGWPNFDSVPVQQVGMLNHVLGTIMLMLLTSMISLPIGISVGVFVHEYAGPKLAGVINFSTTALRSISGIILAITALKLLTLPGKDTFWNYIFYGYGYNINETFMIGRSSFLFAAAFISLLVIPIIAKATQEGLGSLPKDIREGSLAVGASKEHTLFNIQLPWSIPNIITGLMLGCAEAAGALTIIFLMSGSGEYGVGPLNETTSLAYLIFDCRYGRILGDANVQNMLSSYQYTAALLLLIITLGLTVAALIMKKNLFKRYKGA